MIVLSEIPQNPNQVSNTIMRSLPGSERMVGGHHLCMYHDIGDSPFVLRNWNCIGVYIHVARERERHYQSPVCQAVSEGINEMKRFPERAFAVLLNGEHEPGHPLPGVWTVDRLGFRVDFRAYNVSNEKNSEHNLWAERAFAVLLNGEHEPRHPLPGVWTVDRLGFRVDFRAYNVSNEKNSEHNLWAEVYRK
jgi:hypothetical protein